jgi:predicted ArsR family transcriptional regulator
VELRPGAAWDAALDALATLGDAQRRRIYGFVRAAVGPVTREDTAAAMGISRNLAAFHLDKLLDAGLLSSHTARSGGGRRAGRRPKAYQPSDLEVQVNIPTRRHQLLAEILAEAVTGAPTARRVRHAALRVAREHGQALGRSARTSIRGAVGRERGMALAQEALAASGYQPLRTSEDTLRLRNCPFQPVAAQSRELVCGLNHSYLSGLVDAIGAPRIEAVLAPQASGCCVELRQAATSATT